MEHVDSDAAALGDDFSEEVHRVGSSIFYQRLQYSEYNNLSENISKLLYTSSTCARGRAHSLCSSTRRCEARGHSTSAEQLVCHYVPDGSAAGHAGVSAIGLGETRSNQANVRPREYHGRVASVRRGILCACNTKALVCFADVRRCELHVAGDLQLNSSYRAPQPIPPAADRRPCHGWPLIEGGSCGYITLRRSIYVYKLFAL